MRDKRGPWAALSMFVFAAGIRPAEAKSFTEFFLFDTCRFTVDGTNPYFVLTPGHQLVLESEPGRRKKEHVVLVVTVLDETESVGGVRTRVIEERESVDGKLVEVSRNFVAVCDRTDTVVYFGEDVDIYDESGTSVVSHDGAWRVGVDGALPGVIMPGSPLLGARYFQEMAPGIALDRAEIVGLDESVTTPAGTFTGCLRTKESSALDRKARSLKVYAPGVGLIRDDEVVLTRSSPAPAAAR